MKLKGILVELEIIYKIFIGYNYDSEIEYFMVFLMFVCEKFLVLLFCLEVMEIFFGGVELEGLSFEVLL